MKTFKIIASLVLIALLFSCGGGSSAAKQTAQVDSLKINLQKELDSFKKPYGLSENRNSVTDLVVELALFNYWSKIVEEGIASGDSTKERLAISLKQKVSEVQQQQMPQIREAYASILNQKLWEENIKVELNGENKDVLRFTGAVFASNKSIKTVQESLGSMVFGMRYKQTQYKWSEYDSEFTYYDIKPLPDDSVRQINL